ncbi:hypothetical protein HY477_00220 [Candidatus Uhrbacteria bacterium]|nr:hypothetical protein [Candidatus Uhrbacteria bacterium]
MKLSAAQFEELHRAQNLNLSLIGMSNVGKSYWSRALEKIGWARIWSDGSLQARVHATGMLQDVSDEGLARFLGMPYEPGFYERQTQILELERQLFWEIAHELEQGGKGNTVLDPGGSFIYVGEDLCAAFQKHSFMVYLEATPQMRQEMFERFMSFPKALIWQNMFEQKTGESIEDALARCYPKLLEARAQVYAQYADLIVPYPELPRDGNGQYFLDMLKLRL